MRTRIIVVKTIYDGKVGFPEKYDKPVTKIKIGSDIMSLVGKKSVGYSEYMDDKFGRGKYRLVYYVWTPDVFKGKSKKIKDAFDKYNKMTPEERFYKGY